MRSRAWIVRAGSIVTACAVAWPILSYAYTSRERIEFTAGATLSAGGGGGVGTFILRAPNLLPLVAFFGNDVVIPIEIQGQGTISGLQAMGVYQPFDSGNNPLSGRIDVPIAFQPDPGRSNTYTGRIVIPVERLEAARNGSVNYHFALQRGGDRVDFMNGSTPYRIQFTSTLTFQVGQPQGSAAVIHDTNIPDGDTTLLFPPGALTNAGTLIVRQVPLTSVPVGPNGLLPTVVYNFELQGTSLVDEVQITINYPAHQSGSIIGSNGNPALLAPYWLSGFNWLALGPRDWDSRRRTISVRSPHLSTYALILSGAIGAADLRPRRRVITPNGDGINDSIDFSGIGADSEVRFFDLKGRRVRTLRGLTLIWDGRDDDGRIVESGLYLYQYTSLGERVSGVILVAK
ncbi:MAG: hypothetical protein A2992_09670 [Elusimicrobia bacterium RIFCSPLOWO2_01_FULL_59_12]|nr:MAG: hypothetical protein A2992_09670 [Elusimicrobia bacterium RIFCSPLOWO2_01_FULL_59_12]